MDQLEEELVIEIPEKLHFLITESARYKILYGGRGAAKTESIARALLILTCQKFLRVLCCREYQNAIGDSVHSILSLLIQEIWHSGSWVFVWDIQKNTIINKQTGSEFIYSGLRYQIDSIKSKARIDIAWLEEARNSSKSTLEKLGPTIRGQYKDGMTKGGPFGRGPEIWMSFNPELDTDEIYKRAVLEKEKYFPDFMMNAETKKMERYAIVCNINYTDNRFFPEDLRQEMAVSKAAFENDENDTDFLHVWLGQTKKVLEGAVYAKELKKILKDGRRKKVPYNSNKPVQTFWDLGHSDKCAIWFMQYDGFEYNFIHYHENRLQKMPYYIKYLQDTGYLFSVHNLPHDGDAETLSNVTPRKQLQTAFPNAKVRIIERPSKKIVGINAVRTILDLCNFDEAETSEGWACLVNYAYKVDEDNGQFSKEPDHNTPWSHGADAMQTFGLSIKPEKKKDNTISDDKIRTVGSNRNTVNHLTRNNGWTGL